MAKAVERAYRAIRAGQFAQGSHITARRLAEAMGSIDVKANAEVNNRSPKGVLEACGNPRLRDLPGAITEVPLQLSTFRRYSEGQLQSSAAQHAELVAALAARDGNWARSAMNAHIRSVRNMLLHAPASTAHEALPNDEIV